MNLSFGILIRINLQKLRYSQSIGLAVQAIWQRYLQAALRKINDGAIVLGDRISLLTWLLLE